ncbi:MAG: DHH family phosphoesterase [Candidatus Merdivicinus sp.]|jgi:phosphoesterase RecJ-like protein
MEFSLQQAAQFLMESDDIHILCHRNPDGDTLGSAYALWNALRNLGKHAAVRCNDPISSKLSFLANGYQEEMFSPKTIVSVDIADEQLFGDGLSPYLGKVQLAIDHHPSHTYFAENTYLEADSAATCEIICLLIREMKAEITPQIANCLYTGMATDTGCFKFSNTTPRTHRLAADMMEAGCDYAEIGKRIFDTKSRGEFAIEREALNNMEIHFEGKVALIVLTQDMYERCQISEAEADGLTSLPRKLEGVEVGITIKERGCREYKVSMRSVERVNVSELCRQFGGGGHMRAAGFTAYGTLDEVKTLILGAVGRALEENP